MPKEPNHMIQGMWMLLLRTACTEMEKECWFVVNGVPIRYSIREHALLTGLDCHEYPNDWKNLGDLRFVEKVFSKSKQIKLKEVEKKLEGMKSKSTLDRKKLCILYFLCKVLKAKNKAEGNIDPFLLRVVDDLNVCERFPWGRYTFDDCMEGIGTMMKNMKGFVKEGAQPGFSGFIIPLEILAFECIPHLGKEFRVGVSAHSQCPRMCKSKFNDACMKGYPLDTINQKLGDTKEIQSILEPDSEEKKLLERILEDNVDDGLGFIEPIVDNWSDRLLVKRKNIWWKELYEADLRARSVSESKNVDEAPGTTGTAGTASTSGTAGTSELSDLMEVLKVGVEKIMDKLEDIDARVVANNEKIDTLDVRVKDLINFVVYGGTGDYNLQTPIIVPPGPETTLTDGEKEKTEKERVEKEKEKKKERVEKEKAEKERVEKEKEKKKEEEKRKEAEKEKEKKKERVEKEKEKKKEEEKRKEEDKKKEAEKEREKKKEEEKRKEAEKEKEKTKEEEKRKEAEKEKEKKKEKEKTKEEEKRKEAEKEEEKKKEEDKKKEDEKKKEETEKGKKRKGKDEEEGGGSMIEVKKKKNKQSVVDPSLILKTGEKRQRSTTWMKQSPFVAGRQPSKKGKK